MNILNVLIFIEVLFTELTIKKVLLIILFSWKNILEGGGGGYKEKIELKKFILVKENTEVILLNDLFHLFHWKTYVY